MSLDNLFASVSPVRPLVVPIAAAEEVKEEVEVTSKLILPEIDTPMLPRGKRGDIEHPRYFRDEIMHEKAMDADFHPPERVMYEIPLASIHGIDGIVATIQANVIDALKFPKLMTPPKTILLYGPPGTGKSTIALALPVMYKQIRKLEHVPWNVRLYSVTAADIKSRWHGSTESKISLLFHWLRTVRDALEGYRKKHSLLETPIVFLFIDEIDSMLSEGSDKDMDNRRIITQFLPFLAPNDDMNRGIIVVGATNYPWTLSPAVLRRFAGATQILVDLPTVQVVREIIRETILAKVSNYDKSVVACDTPPEVEDCKLYALIDRIAKKAAQTTGPGIQRTPGNLDLGFFGKWLEHQLGGEPKGVNPFGIANSDAVSIAASMLVFLTEGVLSRPHQDCAYRYPTFCPSQKKEHDKILTEKVTAWQELHGLPNSDPCAQPICDPSQQYDVALTKEFINSLNPDYLLEQMESTYDNYKSSVVVKDYVKIFHYERGIPIEEAGGQS